MIREETPAVVLSSSLLQYYLVELDGKVLTISCNRSRGFNTFVLLSIYLGLFHLFRHTDCHAREQVHSTVIDQHPLGLIHKHHRVRGAPVQPRATIPLALPRCLWISALSHVLKRGMKPSRPESKESGHTDLGPELVLF